MATKTTTALEQIIGWSEEQFKSFLVSEDNCVSSKQEEIIQKIQKDLQLLPYKEPYQYVKQLQSNFEYEKITFSDEYYDVLGLEKP